VGVIVRDNNENTMGEIGKQIGLPGPDEKPEKRVLAVSGEGNFGHTKLVTEDYGEVVVSQEFMVRPQTTRFEEDLAIYASPEDILKVHNERPDLLRAKKAKNTCDGDCEKCDTNPEGTCSATKSKEN